MIVKLYQEIKIFLLLGLKFIFSKFGRSYSPKNVSEIITRVLGPASKFFLDSLRPCLNWGGGNWRRRGSFMGADRCSQRWLPEGGIELAGFLNLVQVMPLALVHELSLAPMRRVVVWELSVSNLELGGFCLWVFFFLLLFLYPSKPYFPSVHLFFNSFSFWRSFV